MSQTSETLQARLKLARKQRSITQKQLATLVGMKQPSYNSLEKSTTNSTSRFLPAIAKVLGVNLDWLLYGDTHTTNQIIDNDMSFISLPVIQPTLNEKGDFSLDHILRYEYASPLLLKNIKEKLAHIKFVQLASKSMTPLLYDTDLIGFDTADTDIQEGSIYFILFENEFMFRRIYKESGGILTLNSTNDHLYPAKRIKGNYFGFKVLGKQCFRLG
jgi:transcriptional regulator with XRE-family HTH domain